MLTYLAGIVFAQIAVLSSTMLATVIRQDIPSVLTDDEGCGKMLPGRKSPGSDMGQSSIKSWFSLI